MRFTHGRERRMKWLYFYGIVVPSFYVAPRLPASFLVNIVASFKS
jgi:hypothetical protein